MLMTGSLKDRMVKTKGVVGSLKSGMIIGSLKSEMVRRMVMVKLQIM